MLVVTVIVCELASAVRATVLSASAIVKEGVGCSGSSDSLQAVPRNKNGSIPIKLLKKIAFFFILIN
jgi:hypothetical protein